MSRRGRIPRYRPEWPPPRQPWSFVEKVILLMIWVVINWLTMMWGYWITTKD